jgi:hypothetical protein
MEESSTILAEQKVVAPQTAISFSISLQHPFNRAGGRTFNGRRTHECDLLPFSYRFRAGSMRSREEQVLLILDRATTGSRHEDHRAGDSSCIPS